jgi:hypothetical protein
MHAHTLWDKINKTSDIVINKFILFILFMYDFMLCFPRAQVAIEPKMTSERRIFTDYTKKHLQGACIPKDIVTLERTANLLGLHFLLYGSYHILFANVLCCCKA